MNYFDPQRPRLGNGMPTYLRLTSALPTFNLTPRPDGRVQIMVFLPGSPGRFAPRWAEFDMMALERAIADFIEDPEEWLKVNFGFEEGEVLTWEKKVSPEVVAKADVSADDLGF
jgi:hypothetical protein